MPDDRALRGRPECWQGEHSVMVWLPPGDLFFAGEMLEDDYPRQLVGQRHPAERQAHVAALEVEPARAADHEAEVAAGLAALPEGAAEPDRVELLAVAREQGDEGAVGDAPVDALVLADLDQLEPGVSGQQLLVVLDVVRVRGAQAPDG